MSMHNLSIPCFTCGLEAYSISDEVCRACRGLAGSYVYQHYHPSPEHRACEVEVMRMARSALSIAHVLWDSACHGSVQHDLIAELDALAASEAYYPEDIRPTRDLGLNVLLGNASYTDLMVSTSRHRQSIRYEVSVPLRELYRDRRFQNPGSYRTLCIAAVSFALSGVAINRCNPKLAEKITLLNILNRKVRSENRKKVAAENVALGHYKPPKRPKKRQVNVADGANKRSHTWYRWFNEVPVVMLFAIVVLVVVKPF